MDEISGRLEKLRSRCLRQHCAQLRDKRPRNCVYNVEHTPLPTSKKKSVPTEMELAPRIVTTLVVIQPDAPIRLCMYGAENPAKWEGTVCDRDETAQQCRLFSPRVSEQEAVDQFDALMADDKYVYENHKDIAALQWVLGERIHGRTLSWWDRLLLWLDKTIRRMAKSEPKKLPEHDDDLPGGLWSDADAEDSGERPPPFQK